MMNEKTRQDRWFIYVVAAFQSFIGLGGVAGGLGLVLDPSGDNLGLPLAWLSRSPFADYLIPGLVLLVVIGGGTLLGGMLTLRRHRYAAEAAMALGGLLMLWIVAQVWWIGLSHWLQPVYFAFGVVELSLGQRMGKLRGI
ncbi:MAG: hypothetical protein KC418_01025 [Anaerolineales bacterium]|nr:hypothetical protein [Anaerolineales bacterium]MCB8953108.1 hypothetical protein [Ardenticatenales bacterium]